MPSRKAPTSLPQLRVLHQPHNLRQRSVGAHPAAEGQGSNSIRGHPRQRQLPAASAMACHPSTSPSLLPCPKASHLEARMRRGPPTLTVPPITLSPAALCTGAARGAGLRWAGSVGRDRGRQAGPGNAAGGRAACGLQRGCCMAAVTPCCKSKTQPPAEKPGSLLTLGFTLGLNQ